MSAFKVFTLQCHQGHFFEGWFPSQDAFDGQVHHQQIGCPTCLSRKVWVAHVGEVAAFQPIDALVAEDSLHPEHDEITAARAAILRLQQRIVEATQAHRAALEDSGLAGVSPNASGTNSTSTAGPNPAAGWGEGQLH